jgi:hypothetical protein
MRRALLLAAAVLLSARAEALILDSGDGLGNTTPPTDDPGWSHVGNVNGLTGTYLGFGWVLTAAHVGVGNCEFEGVFYGPVAGSAVQLHNPDDTPADLLLFRIDPSPDLPPLPIRSSTPSVNASLDMIARGLARGAPTTWGGFNGYEWGGAVGMRWGTNRIAANNVDIGTRVFSTSFTPISGGGTSQEAQGATGDSGGAVFIKSGGNWQLAGTLISIGQYAGQPWTTALYGNLTYAADLAQYRSQLIAITRPQCSNEIDDDGDSLIDWPADPQCTSAQDISERVDADGDGVLDPSDNCLFEPNPDQVDTDQDGYGNLCDADLNDDGLVGGPDFNLFRAAFGRAPGEPGYDPDADFTGDGAIGGPDFNVIRAALGAAPGPSGLVCAGSPPCP